MKRLLLAAALASLAVGCASRSGYSSLGYVVTDDGLDGCAFRYAFYPYYDPYAPVDSARIEIIRVDRTRITRTVDRTDPLAGAHSGGWSEASTPAGSTPTERAPVAPPASPPPPRVIEPRS